MFIYFASQLRPCKDRLLFSNTPTTSVLHSTSTKALFNDLGVDAKVYELDKMDDGSDIQNSLLQLSGQRTVPNVFIKGSHLGGNDDSQRAARTGKLQEMLGLEK